MPDSCWLFSLGVMALSGCAGQYKRPLFLFQATDAAYPVMLSRGPKSEGDQVRFFVGHVEMASGQRTYSTGVHFVGRTAIATSATEMFERSDARSISENIAHEVTPGARWVQINGFVYVGDDAAQNTGFSMSIGSSRKLDVEGMEHR